MSFKPSASDCVAFPNSTTLGARVPPSSLSAAEEGLASPSEIFSSGVGIDHDKVRLIQPGKSDFEDTPF